MQRGRDTSPGHGLVLGQEYCVSRKNSRGKMRQDPGELLSQYQDRTLVIDPLPYHRDIVSLALNVASEGLAGRTPSKTLRTLVACFMSIAASGTVDTACDQEIDRSIVSQLAKVRPDSPPAYIAADYPSGLAPTLSRTSKLLGLSQLLESIARPHRAAIVVGFNKATMNVLRLMGGWRARLSVPIVFRPFPTFRDVISQYGTDIGKYVHFTPGFYTQMHSLDDDDGCFTVWVVDEPSLWLARAILLPEFYVTAQYKATAALLRAMGVEGGPVKHVIVMESQVGYPTSDIFSDISTIITAAAQQPQRAAEALPLNQWCLSQKALAADIAEKTASETEFRTTIEGPMIVRIAINGLDLYCTNYNSSAAAQEQLRTRLLTIHELGINSITQPNAIQCVPEFVSRRVTEQGLHELLRAIIPVFSRPTASFLPIIRRNVSKQLAPIITRSSVTDRLQALAPFFQHGYKGVRLSTQPLRNWPTFTRDLRSGGGSLNAEKLTALLERNPPEITATPLVSTQLLVNRRLSEESEVRAPQLGQEDQSRRQLSWMLAQPVVPVQLAATGPSYFAFMRTSGSKLAKNRAYGALWQHVNGNTDALELLNEEVIVEESEEVTALAWYTRAFLSALSDEVPAQSLPPDMETASEEAYTYSSDFATYSDNEASTPSVSASGTPAAVEAAIDPDVQALLCPGEQLALPEKSPFTDTTYIRSLHSCFFSICGHPDLLYIPPLQPTGSPTFAISHADLQLYSVPLQPLMSPQTLTAMTPHIHAKRRKMARELIIRDMQDLLSSRRYLPAATGRDLLRARETLVSEINGLIRSTQLQSQRSSLELVKIHFENQFSALLQRTPPDGLVPDGGVQLCLICMREAPFPRGIYWTSQLASQLLRFLLDHGVSLELLQGESVPTPATVFAKVIEAIGDLSPDLVRSPPHRDAIIRGLHAILQTLRTATAPYILSQLGVNVPAIPVVLPLSPYQARTILENRVLLSAKSSQLRRVVSRSDIARETLQPEQIIFDFGTTQLLLLSSRAQLVRELLPSVTGTASLDQFLDDVVLSVQSGTVQRLKSLLQTLQGMVRLAAVGEPDVLPAAALCPGSGMPSWMHAEGPRPSIHFFDDLASVVLPITALLDIMVQYSITSIQRLHQLMQSTIMSQLPNLRKCALLMALQKRFDKFCEGDSAAWELDKPYQDEEVSKALWPRMQVIFDALRAERGIICDPLGEAIPPVQGQREAALFFQRSRWPLGLLQHCRIFHVHLYVSYLQPSFLQNYRCQSTIMTQTQCYSDFIQALDRLLMSISNDELPQTPEFDPLTQVDTVTSRWSSLLEVAPNPEEDSVIWNQIFRNSFMVGDLRQEAHNISLRLAFVDDCDRRPSTNSAEEGQNQKVRNVTSSLRGILEQWKQRVGAALNNWWFNGGNLPKTTS